MYHKQYLYKRVRYILSLCKSNPGMTCTAGKLGTTDTVDQPEQNRERVRFAGHYLELPSQTIFETSFH